MMKKIRISLAAALLIAFAFFAVAGLKLSFHGGMQQKEGTLSSAESNMPCFFMGETSICLMSPLKHIEQFFDLMETVVPAPFIYLIVLLSLIAGTKIFIRCLLWCTERWACLDAKKNQFLRIFAAPNFQRHAILAVLSKIHPRLYS